MKLAAILILAAAPGLVCSSPMAAGRHNDRNWKLDEKESIRRTFDVAGSGAHKLLVDNIHGFVHVTGYAGSKIEVSIEKHIFADSDDAVAEAKRDVKMDLSQQGNFVRCYEDGPFRSHNGTNYRGEDYYGYRVVFDFEVQVPFDTELVIKTVNRGDIEIKKTTGDYDIHGLNGGIEMEQISGSGAVHTLNGSVKVSFARNPSKPTQIKTLNGTVDVYFQKELNADLHFKKLNGAIYTDFDVSSLPLAASGGLENGKFVYRSSGKMAARAGKGGPELSFETLNGSIRLHTTPL
jgi:hypothetical protein